MQTIAQIRELLAQYNIHPKKRFGQNFLHDQNQVRKLLDAAAIQTGDVVLEVGPGTGMLTDALVESGAVVIACEIDTNLAQLLRDRFENRITLIEGDALEKGRALTKSAVNAIAGRLFKMVANLPYQIASPLMADLVLNHSNCVGQCVTIQKEVADRLLAAPGTDDYGPLGIIVQAFSRVEKISVVPPACFWPPPQVTSAMIAIHPIPAESPDRPSQNTTISITDRPAFARFITTLFSKRRKQLGSIFGRDTPLPAGIDQNARPEKLTINQLIELFSAVQSSATQ